RGWVAHIFHMKTAGDPFKKLIGSGWKPTAQMANPDNYPVAIKTPEGPITVEGTRRNARMLIEYVEGWLGGRGAKGIDSLEGKPGVHPALMEDLATGRMSVAQIAQRIIHRARETGSGTQHDFTLVKRLLNEELADILTRRQGAETHERYRKALKIAMRWIKNYTELTSRASAPTVAPSSTRSPPPPTRSDAPPDGAQVPVTPFHFGPGLALKGLAAPVFSWSAFAAAAAIFGAVCLTRWRRWRSP